MKKSVVFLSLALSLIIFLSGCEMPSFSGQDLGDPSGLVADFVILMRDRRFTEASNLLDSSVSLNLENGLIFEDDPVTQKLADMLLNSYSVEFVPDGVKKHGRSAEISVKFTSLNCAALTEKLAELVRERAFYEAKPETDEEALALFNKVWEDEFSGGEIDMTGYYIQREATAGAKYVPGAGWRLVITESFYNAMLGK